MSKPLPVDRLRAAARAVLSDFPEGDAVQLTVSCSQESDGSWGQVSDGSWWQVSDGSWWLKIAEDSGSYVVHRLAAPPSEAELLVSIAYYLQDHVFDTEPWGEPRPICPGHPHPPDPSIINGTAVWTCPRDARVLAPIGKLIAP